MQPSTFLCVLALCALLQVPYTSAIFGDWTFKWPWESSEEEDTNPSGGSSGGSSEGSTGGSSGGSPSSGGSGSGATEAEQYEIVARHNALRRSVQPSASNMLKMSWNTEAAANAQAWVNKCIGGHSKSEDQVISTSKCGENWAGSQVRVSWSTIIQNWYDEVNNWRYGVGPVYGEVGHFTQIVWYNSIYVGCGMAYCPNLDYPYQYVCQYCPPGNYQFKTPYKSGRSCGDCPRNCNDKLCTNPCLHKNKYSNCASLVDQWSCNNKDISSWCPASCKCTNNEII